jgi:hypothetical protein
MGRRVSSGQWVVGREESNAKRGRTEVRPYVGKRAGLKPRHYKGKGKGGARSERLALGPDGGE